MAVWPTARDAAVSGSTGVDADAMHIRVVENNDRALNRRALEAGTSASRGTAWLRSARRRILATNPIRAELRRPGEGGWGMSDQLGVPTDPGPAATEAEPAPRFAWRAVLVLTILGVLSLLAGLFVVATGDRSAGQLVAAGAMLAGALGYLTLAAALRQGRAWADSWARVALAIVIVVGVVHTVVGLANSSLWIPLDALMAVWALFAGEGGAPGRSMLRSAGPAVLALILIGEAAAPLGTVAAELAKSAPDPNAVIVVHNQSPRAVLVLLGGPFVTRSHTTFVTACGGVARIPVAPADYESDGRLMAFIAIDASGQLDAWAATEPAGTVAYDGSYSISPIWSRGELAGTLPLELVVHPDLTVDTSVPSPASCTPNASAGPAGG